MDIFEASTASKSKPSYIPFRWLVPLFVRSKNVNRRARGVAVRFIHGCIDEANRLHRVAQAKLKPFAWNLANLRWARWDGFNAVAFYERGRYRIHIAIEAPATLLSVAHELSSVGSLPAGGATGTIQSSVHCWLQNVSSEGEVTEAARQWAMDGFDLLYYHELSHVTAGHTCFPLTRPLQRRALEFDADYNAGSYFVGALIKATIPTADIVERLIHAAFLLSTILKAVSKPTDEYHYPTVRAIAFMSGGFSTLASPLPAPLAIAQIQQWEALAAQRQIQFQVLLAHSSLRAFAGDPVALIDDVNALGGVTIPDRERLKNGPLSKLSLASHLKAQQASTEP
jgi:hypothetical protein